MKTITALTAFVLLSLAESTLCSKTITLSNPSESGTVFDVTVPAARCSSSSVNTDSLSGEYKSVVTCSLPSATMPKYYNFEYDRNAEAFTYAFDSFGNQGPCVQVSSSPRKFDCTLNETAIKSKRALDAFVDCDAERKKCIKVCDKGSRSPACYRNCTSLYNKCKAKPTVKKDCDADRQKCIKVCDKGSRSPACYRNCTSLYNECKATPPVKKDCDADRQKCIKVCDKGSRSPACYRNCTALYNKCKEEKGTASVKENNSASAAAVKVPIDQCETNKQQCIKVCDNGSKSPACYRNCTFVYNECKQKKEVSPITQCDTKRQQCIKVCDGGSKSPACYRNCTALHEQCTNKYKPSLNQAFVSRQKI